MALDFEPTDAQLSAYLEEALPAPLLSAIEQRLRHDASLRDRLTAVIGREDAGLHSIGVIWRRRRLSCPGRDDWSRYVLGVLDDDEADYFRFHLEEVGCRYCAANLEDLKASSAASTANDAAEKRQRRFFQTSAGHLRKDR